MRQLSRGIEVKSAQSLGIEIVDSIGTDGPKVAVLDPSDVVRLKREAPGVRLSPVRKYRCALRPVTRVSTRALGRTGSATIQYKIFVKERKTGKPLADVTVIAITDRGTHAGVRRRTGTTGQATITLTGPSIAQLFVYPPPGYWGLYRENHRLQPGEIFELEPLDVKFVDFMRHCYPNRRASDGRGVRVAVVDTGVLTTHSDFKVRGGANLVPNEDPNDYGSATGHGTHVAGIIGGKGFGLAPLAEVYSYRVFPHGGGTADSVALYKAIKRAIADKCDLINLSLGGGLRDDALNEAIGEAFEKGCVTIAAAGNARRSPVAYPAWIKRAIAVSAIGRIGNFPQNSVEAADVSDERSKSDSKVFVAGFSNIGRELDFTAPGVGIISAWSDGRYAVESGTSMACPVVTGVAAALLSRTTKLLEADRDVRRALGIKDLIENASRSMGFPQSLEGFGQPAL